MLVPVFEFSLHRAYADDPWGMVDYRSAHKRPGGQLLKDLDITWSVGEFFSGGEALGDFNLG